MSEKLGLQSLQDYCLPQRSLPILGLLIGSFVGKVIIEKSRGKVSLVEQDTISWPIKF